MAPYHRKTWHHIIGKPGTVATGFSTLKSHSLLIRFIRAYFGALLLPNPFEERKRLMTGPNPLAKRILELRQALSESGKENRALSHFTISYDKGATISPFLTFRDVLEITQIIDLQEQFDLLSQIDSKIYRDIISYHYLTIGQQTFKSCAILMDHRLIRSTGLNDLQDHLMTQLSEDSIESFALANKIAVQFIQHYSFFLSVLNLENLHYDDDTPVVFGDWLYVKAPEGPKSYISKNFEKLLIPTEYLSSMPDIIRTNFPDGGLFYFEAMGKHPSGCEAKLFRRISHLGQSMCYEADPYSETLFARSVLNLTY